MRQGGGDVTAPVAGHLDYVSQLAGRLGVNDPVESYLTPVVGRWTDLHDEADRWRAAAQVAESTTQRLTGPLGGLDAAWQGKDADSFLAYMHQVGLAGNDLSDAMTTMADALDRTADSVQQIVQEMVDLLADTAEQASDAMTVPVSGKSRATKHLDELDEPTSKLHESVQEILKAFAELCDGMQAGQSFGTITMAHHMPTQNWSSAPQPLPRAVTPVVRQPTVTASPAQVATPAHAAAPAHGAAPAHVAAPAAHVAAHVAAQPAAHVAQPAAHAGQPAAHAGASTAEQGAQATHQSPPAHAAAPPAAAAAPPPAASTSGQPLMSGVINDPTTDSMSGQLPTDESSAGGADGAGAAGGGQQGGMPMGGMGGMGNKGGDQEHKSKIRLSGDITDIFGTPDRTAPPTIGG